MRPLPALIFSSRWLQLPLYLGLILAHFIERYYRNLEQPAAACYRTPCYTSRQYLFGPTI